MIRQRRMIVKIAWANYGRWYRWGGDDPSGFDCSGLVIEVLQSVGLLPMNFDGTANFLARQCFPELYEHSNPLFPEQGDLVFWRSPQYFSHVEIAIAGDLSIGASGGGRNVRTMEDAIKYNAFIKVRPINRETARKVYFGKIDEFKTS